MLISTLIETCMMVLIRRRKKKPKKPLFRNFLNNKNNPIFSIVYKNYRSALKKLLINGKKKYFGNRFKKAFDKSANT